MMNDTTNTKRSPVDTDEIVRLVNEGKTYAEIGEKTGISRATVSRIYNKNTGKRLRKKPVDVGQVLELEAGGMRVNEIAVRLGYPPKTIYSALRRRNEGASPDDLQRREQIKEDQLIATFFQRKDSNQEKVRASA